MVAAAGAVEVNFDGLVGPTHNYAGLSYGNVASSEHGGLVSSPRQAALQGLEKMWSLRQLGMGQAVLPPQERPHLPTLQRLGFGGAGPQQILDRVYRQAPKLLTMVSSASGMWVANAATISPFADSSDGRTHITPANLVSMFHRAIEVDTTTRVLAAVFKGEDYCHHPALPAGATFSDEGAANHSRFCGAYGESGVELFVYGAGIEDSAPAPKRYPARQTLEASRAVARNHRIIEGRAVFAQQNPEAIDAGVFHNDVIATGNLDLLLFHEQAFLNTGKVKQQLDAAAAGMGIPGLNYIEVPKAAVSLHDAVASYLFNSQLLSVPGTVGATVIAPSECRAHTAVNRYLQSLEADSPLIDRVVYVDLRQSMNNGGGPACLRLRVVMSQAQIEAMNANVFLDETLYRQLKDWIRNHYRDRLAADDLRDAALLDECRRALDQLSGILNLGPVYDFQLDS